ncbi:unnamed protein product [Prunus armeniaca]
MCFLSHVQAFVNQRLPLRLLVSMGRTTFSGQNRCSLYQSIFQMEHLLSEPCPRSEAAFEKWMHADHRSNLLYRFGRYGEQEFQTWPERSRRALGEKNEWSMGLKKEVDEVGEDRFIYEVKTKP